MLFPQLKKVCKVGHGAHAQTTNSIGLKGFWFGQAKRGEVELIDTPGVNDTKGRDVDHMAKMVHYLKRGKYVNLIAIVENCEFARCLHVRVRSSCVLQIRRTHSP